MVPTPSHGDLKNISSRNFRSHVGLFPHPFGCGAIDLGKSASWGGAISPPLTVRYVVRVISVSEPLSSPNVM